MNDRALPAGTSAQRDEHKHLDIHEMERRVAAALVKLVDDPGERQRITPRLLARLTNLPLHRVREVTDGWNLQTLSGDEYWLGPGSVAHARELCAGRPLTSD
jgi:hypothetical protein